MKSVHTALLHEPSHIHGYYVVVPPLVTDILYPAHIAGVKNELHDVFPTHIAFQLQTFDDSNVLVHDFSLTVSAHEVAAIHPAPVVTQPV